MGVFGNKQPVKLPNRFVSEFSGLNSINVVMSINQFLEANPQYRIRAMCAITGSKSHVYFEKVSD